MVDAGDIFLWPPPLHNYYIYPHAGSLTFLWLDFLTIDQFT